LVRSWFAILVLSASSVFAAEQELRVFQFHFRPAHEAATLVEPMLSGEGSLLLQPGLNAITVRDNPDVLKRVASALASWDVAPQSYKVRVRVFLASREPKSSGPPPPPIPELGEKLYLLFGFTKFQEVAAVQATAADGDAVETAAGDHYHLRFTVRSVPQEPERVQLAQLQLARRDRAADNTERLTPLLRATVSLLMKQPSVIAGARSENASQAFFLLLSAEREGKQ